MYYKTSAKLILVNVFVICYSFTVTLFIYEIIVLYIWLCNYTSRLERQLPCCSKYVQIFS